MEKTKITTEAKYRTFAAEFAKDLSPRRAYERCPFWSATGPSASVNASRLLSREDVKSWIREAMARQQQRYEAEEERRFEERMAPVRERMRKKMYGG